MGAQAPLHTYLFLIYRVFTRKKFVTKPDF